MYLDKSTHVYTQFEFYPAGYLAVKENTLGCYEYTFDNGYNLILPTTIDLDIGTEIVLKQPIRTSLPKDLRLAEILGLIYAYHVKVGTSDVLYLPAHTEEDLHVIVETIRTVFRKYLGQEVTVYYDPKTRIVDLDMLFALLKTKMNWTIDKLFKTMYTYDIASGLQFVKAFVPIMDEYNKGYGIRFHNVQLKMYMYNLFIRFGFRPMLEDEYLIIPHKDYNALKDMLALFNIEFAKPHKLTIVSKQFIGYRRLVFVPDKIIQAIDGLSIEQISSAKTNRLKEVIAHVGD